MIWKDWRSGPVMSGKQPGETPPKRHYETGRPVADPSRLRKRSVMIAGHRTSVSLEDAFWEVLKELADQRGLSLNQLVAEVDEGRSGNLSSALRVFALRETCG